MDMILKGILDSDHSKTIKRCVIEKKLIPASRAPVPPGDCQKVFAHCWKVLADAETSTFDKEMALKVWKTWASNKSAEFEEFAKEFPQVPSGLPVKTKLGCLEAVCHGMGNCPSSQQRLVTVAENMAEELIVAQEAELEDVAAATELLRRGGSLRRPSHLACLIVHRLASSPYRNTHDSSSFYQHATAIADFLKELLQTYPSCVAEVVARVFQLLADPSGSSYYSTLAPVIEVLDVRHCQSVLAAIQASSMVLAGPPQLVLALARLFTMLFWPYASRNLPQWIALALRALGPPRWCPLLHTLLNSKLLEILDMILIPASSHAAVEVFCDVLLSYQPAHEHFEQVVEKLGPVAERLQAENPTDWNFLASTFLLFLKFNKDFSLVYGRRCYPLLVLRELEPPPHPQVTEAGQDLVQQLESQYLCRGQRLAAVYQDKQPSAGLNNVGNTCYINSILQALFATPRFRNYVLSAKPTAEQPVLRDLRELFAFLFLSKRPSVDPDQYMPSLLLSNFFKGGEQQDCQEYLQHLLNQLPHCGEVFGVAMQTTVVCQNCQASTTHKLERSLDLLLHFPHSAPDSSPQIKGGGAFPEAAASSSTTTTPITTKKEESVVDGEAAKLEELLKAVQEGEVLDDYLCEKCKSEVKALRQTNVVELPNHLILTVLRHSHNKQCSTKILRHIEFPETLAFSSSEDGCHSYSLYALVVHQGSNMNCGHYFTYARSPWHWDRWYLYDDHTVTKVEFSEISANDNTRKNTYQLFYRKVEEGQGDDDYAAQDTYAALESLDLRLRQKISDDNEAFVKGMNVAWIEYVRGTKRAWTEEQVSPPPPPPPPPPNLLRQEAAEKVSDPPTSSPPDVSSDDVP